MNIYKVTRPDGADYDEYEGFVCSASSEEEALNFHPNGGILRPVPDFMAEAQERIDKDRTIAEEAIKNGLTKREHIEMYGSLSGWHPFREVWSRGDVEAGADSLESSYWSNWPANVENMVVELLGRSESEVAQVHFSAYNAG